MELHTPRLLLRSYRRGDLAAVHRFASDRRLTEYVEWGPNTAQDSRDFLAACLAETQQDPRRAFTFAITASDTVSDHDGGGPAAGPPFGSVGLTLDDAGTGEVGYVIAADRWGCGYATEAAAAVVHFGFTVLGLDRIRATCRPGNAASSRVLEKTGMALEARLPAHKLIRGQWEDSLLYAISPS
ncbi:GNAT family N-acetyltransferase [Arthrobacter gengyunqii]|uniref:GNAT family N-acetyltransferase n=1 Tax=Arthrobacter gengyunqii TaxID=2886940 RepID=A0A9X1S6Q2_9MICC|nr:GNAT family N-acetyltransferase [Arthrobacter gengyunqii]MCC3269157.1 GNAT family N-acetyltransferase [Arthrobacter gengyunqii]UOY94882.1 GNAT family N-acetyltransferase [Arthrobacter gengyunqii]